MKRLNIVAAIALAFLFVAGCTEKYGQGVNKNIPTIKVKDVIVNPSFQNKLVNLEGKILTQCGTKGCWFFLKDDTGHILIDCDPKGFSIPPNIGRNVKVTGVVSREAGDVKIIAHGVEVY